VKPCDLLFLGAHPDDVEISCAGTILRCVAQGLKVSIADATAGEKGTRGTREQRAAEAAAAAAKLGLHERSCLGLPDTQLAVDERSLAAVVGAIRSTRCRMLVSPIARDAHPDHVALGQLAEKAFFLAGLRHHAPELGAPHRPRVHLRYLGNQPVEPTIALDISDLAAEKAEVVRCYASQLSPPEKGHLLQGLDVLDRAIVRDRFHGSRIGVAAAEAFFHDGPLPLSDLSPLMR